MTKEIRTIPIQDLTIRKSETDETKSVVGGYVNKFEQMSEDLGWFKEKVRKGAFVRSLKEQPVLAFWNHNSDIVLGNTENNTLKAWEDEVGLRFELELPDTTAGNDAGKLIERGDVRGVSFGFNTRKEEWDETDKNNPIRTLVDVQLYEISPTPLPAYTQSNVSARAVMDEHNEELKKLSEARELKRVRAAQVHLMQIKLMEMEAII